MSCNYTIELLTVPFLVLKSGYLFSLSILKSCYLLSLSVLNSCYYLLLSISESNYCLPDLTYHFSPFSLDHPLFLIISFIVLAMMSISSMLNKSVDVPDWKRERDRKKKDENDVIERLKKQREQDKNKIERIHRTVYDDTYTPDATLSIHLIGVFHNMWVTQTYYELDRQSPYGLMQPKPGTKGPKGRIVNARNYLEVSGYDWK